MKNNIIMPFEEMTKLIKENKEILKALKELVDITQSLSEIVRDQDEKIQFLSQTLHSLIIKQNSKHGNKIHS
jgi:hypothetical protein